jgi:hypothetical protein
LGIIDHLLPLHSLPTLSSKSSYPLSKSYTAFCQFQIFSYRNHASSSPSVSLSLLGGVTFPGTRGLFCSRKTSLHGLQEPLLAKALTWGSMHISSRVPCSPSRTENNTFVNNLIVRTKLLVGPIQMKTLLSEDNPTN